MDNKKTDPLFMKGSRPLDEQQAAEDEAKASVIVFGSGMIHDSLRGPAVPGSTQRDTIMAMVAIERTLCERELEGAVKS